MGFEPAGALSADELEVASPGRLEACASGIELVAELGEAALGEVVRLELEAGGDQLDRAAAGVARGLMSGRTGRRT
jgi:hypothetical protein